MITENKTTYSFYTNVDYENCKDFIINKYGYLAIITWTERKEIAIRNNCFEKDEIKEILTNYNGVNITDYK